MRKAMTRKFIAAIMVFAMLFGTFSAFAAPVLLPDGRDPAAGVSLTVWHSRGALPTPVNNVTTNGIPAGRLPVVGATWHMQRIIGPANFPPEIYAAPPEQPQMAGLSTVPSAVRDAILAQSFGAALPDGRLPVTGQTGWYVTSDRITRVTEDGTGATFAGRAYFDAAAISAAANGGNAAGQGLWLVWEEHVPGQVVCHDTGDPVDHDVLYVIRPFLVNLPTYQHIPAGGQPGEWIYHVHVHPKGPRITEFTKTAGDTPVIGHVPGGTTDPNSEYSILDWQISFNFDNVLNQILPVEADPTATPPILAHDGFFVTIPHADRPGVNVNGTASETFILVQDLLDHRMRLLDADYDGTTGTGPIATRAAAAGVTPIVVGANGNVDANHWLHISVDPEGAAPQAALPRVATNGDVNWVVNYTMTAGTPQQQRFSVHFTEHGVRALVAAAPEGGEVSIDFRTIVSDLTQWDDLNPITNTAYINLGSGGTVGIPEGQRPSVQLHGLVVNKENESGQPLDGAVFFLYTVDQVTEAPAGVWTVNAGELPHRIAISGGAAGSTITNWPTNPALTQAERDLIETKDALALATAGEAIFLNLVAGTQYFLYEAVAPTGGFRRITSVRPLDALNSWTCSYAGHTDVPADCIAPGASDDCIRVYRTYIRFTNTRDFYLPMTGGAGTIMFTTAGISLMGIAGLFLFLARKKDKNKAVRTQ